MAKELVRLQKFMSECGVASRRRSEKLITSGRVRVNGKRVIELGSKVDPEKDRVEVDGRPLKSAPKGVIILNKPRGVISTLDDPEGRRSVAQYLTKPYRSYYPVGRLDLDSSGLLILTNDGLLAERLLHPRYQLERGYLCELKGFITEAVMQKLEKGIKLEDGTAQARIEPKERNEEKSLVHIMIKEGRNRIVRRMMEEVGHPVLFLKRMWHGPFKLGSLKSGQIRKIPEKEYLRLRAKVLDRRSAVS